MYKITAYNSHSLQELGVWFSSKVPQTGSYYLGGPAYTLFRQTSGDPTRHDKTVHIQNATVIIEEIGD